MSASFSMEGQQEKHAIKRRFSQINIEEDKSAHESALGPESLKKKSKQENSRACREEDKKNTPPEPQILSSSLAFTCSDHDKMDWVRLAHGLSSKEKNDKKTLMQLFFCNNQKCKDGAANFFYEYLANYHELPEHDYKIHMWADNLLHEFASSQNDRKRNVAALVLFMAFEKCPDKKWGYKILKELCDKDDLNKQDTAAQVISKGIVDNKKWAADVFEELVQSTTPVELKIAAIVIKRGIKDKVNKNYREWAADLLASFRISPIWQKAAIRALAFLEMLKEDKFYGREILVSEYVDNLPEIVIDKLSQLYSFRDLSKDLTLPQEEHKVYKLFAERVDRLNRHTSTKEA